MKKYILLFVMVAAMSTTFAKTGKLTGVIDDSMCAAKGKCDSKDPVACATKCIKMGSPAVLVVGKKIYKITNQDMVIKYAGKKVTVDGDITDAGIKVTKVTEAK